MSNRNFYPFLIIQTIMVAMLFYMAESHYRLSFTPENYRLASLAKLVVCAIYFYQHTNYWLFFKRYKNKLWT